MVQEPDRFPFLVVGNKIDLEKDRIVKTDKLQKFCSENGNMMFIEASARENMNIELAFARLAEQALVRQNFMQRQIDES